MNTTHEGFLCAISALRTHFRKRTWSKVLTLITGALLCPGSRTVANCLRALGLDARSDFCKYHRVLSRAPWSGLACAHTLLRLLLGAFARDASEPLVFAIDETIERRWGRRIRARGIYRDAVSSSNGRAQITSGLRWVSLTLVARVPWARAPWALPVLTALCPSERYYTHAPDGTAARRPRKLTDCARQVIRWMGRYVVGGAAEGLGRNCVLTADRSYCTYALFAAARQAGVTLVTDMRLDARLFALPSPREPGRPGRPAIVGERLRPMASLAGDAAVEWRSVTLTSSRGGARQRHFDYCTGTARWYKPGEEPADIRWVLTSDPAKVPGQEGYLRLVVSGDPDLDAEDVLRYYARRWACEVTFAEVRRHLGVETQRQWSDRAIARATPCTMALMSVACLVAHEHSLVVESGRAAWYAKAEVTFSDVLVAVRKPLWASWIKSTSPLGAEVDKPSDRIRYLTDALDAVQRTLMRCAA